MTDNLTSYGTISKDTVARSKRVLASKAVSDEEKAAFSALFEKTLKSNFVVYDHIEASDREKELHLEAIDALSQEARGSPAACTTWASSRRITAAAVSKSSSDSNVWFPNQNPCCRDVGCNILYRRS